MQKHSAIFSIIDDQPDFVLVHKHQAAEFHCNRDQIGLFEQVKEQCGLADLYPVHRLDRETTGLILFAKNKVAAKALGLAFAQHQVDKYYLALSPHKPKKKQGSIIGDMALSRRGSYKLLKTKDNPAITQFKSIGIDVGFSSHSVLVGSSDFLRLFLLRPKTGKTHQLRVALKSLSSPVFGDARYDLNNKTDRMYLHAYWLGFTLGDQRYEYVALPQQGVWFKHLAIVKYIEAHWSQPMSLSWPTR